MVTNGIGDKAFYNNVLLNVEDIQEIDITIYPNPATSTIFVKFSNLIERVKIYAINGQQVLLAKENVSQIDVSKLKAGVYFIEVETKQSTQIKKIIIK